jgi:hypothetical protein
LKFNTGRTLNDHRLTTIFTCQPGDGQAKYMKDGPMSDTLIQHTEYRHCHFGGAVYLAVEGVLWLLSASLGSAGLIPAAILVLIIGGMFIHPIALGCSRLLRMNTPHESNRLSVLNTLLALTIPLGLPLIFMATSAGREVLFFPAFTVLVGAHWLPFNYLYSMKSFFALAGILVLVGILFGFVFTQSFAICGFITGSVHIFFAVFHFFIVRHEHIDGQPGQTS